LIPQQVPTLEHGKLPLPRDKRLLKVCELLMETPGNMATMDVLGMQAGASMRMFHRALGAPPQRYMRNSHAGLRGDGINTVIPR
jgi:transcriptional regulator GlxA family with amidase domain